MPSSWSRLFISKRTINRIVRFLSWRALHRRLVCCALIFNILLWPGHAATVESISQLSSSMGHSISILSTGPTRIFAAVFKFLFGPARPARQAETLADRLAGVAHVRISPSKFVGYEGGSVTLTAHPTDYLDRAVQGVRFTWESSNASKVEIDEMGRARFVHPGLARITCRAGLIEATALVLVRPGRRPHQTDEEWRADQSSLQANADPLNSTSGFQSTGSRLSSLLDKLTPTVSAQGFWLNDLGYDQLWSEGRNLVGSPRNRAIEPTAIGPVLPEGSNFNWAVPLVNLSGRGLNLNLTLYYNSRLWTRRNNTLAFDAIAGWPAPGFSLGFGRIVYYNAGATGKYLLVDPDGTRHALSRLSPGGPLETTDGTHIVYSGDVWNGGDLHYPDGTTAVITVVNNRLLPTVIMDKSGNYIQIAYKPECDQLGYCDVFPPMAIEYIVDTLGRRIEFQYDANGKLTSITRPGFGGTVPNPITQTLVQFDYQALSASTNFAGLTVERGLTWAYTLKHIYFPATGTGYKPSYSEYGMIYNISARRGMTSSTWPAGNPPAITDGVESASIAFNYPTSSQTLLSDVPAFTQRTETAVNSPQSQYSYTPPADPNAQSLTFTIARPDSTTLLLTRLNNSASPGNGLLTQSEIKIGSTSLSKTDLNYVNDAGGSPQVQSTTSYDDAATPIKVDFDYDQYGNITNKREYGYKINGTWQVRRRTHYTYKTDSGYIISYLRGLVTLVEIFDAKQDSLDSNDDLIAKTSYAYDNFAAMGGLENYGGIASPPGHINVGPSAKVTGVTEWVDFTAPTPTVIQRLAKIDIFGNVVRAQISCCQEKDLTNTDATYWSQPSEEMNGDPNGVHQTTSIDYDFNTSLAKSRTDAAGLVTNIGYNALLQPSGYTLPSGESAYTIMDYGALSSTSTVTYDDGGVMKTVTSSAQYDGWGRVIQAVAPNNAQVNTAYNSMGRAISRTNPFPAGGTPGPLTTIQYDISNQAVVTTLPDGNTLRTDYSGSKVTTTDQVGRKMRRESDGFGRLVKVTEQDSTGALTQETGYSYNLLDKLTAVNQGNQTREFKYDSLGRLLYERIPEQSATINDGTGVMWTCKYAYTEFSAVSTKQDARGVITTYGYDALHRLNSISYNSVSGVATAPAVSYTYDNDPSFGTSANGMVVRVNVGSDYQGRYTFDNFKRISSVIHTLGTRSYTAGYQYNQASQLTQLTYPSTRAVTVGYDSIGRISGLTGYLSNVSYRASGQVSGLTLGNGVVESYGYDSQRLQLTSQSATKGGVTLMSETYGYQASGGQNGVGTTAGNTGQLMTISGAINGAAESAAYTYDLQGRLATSNQASNGTSAQRRFAYDRWGNRTGAWDAVSGGTQIQAITLGQSGGAPTNRVASIINQSTTASYTYDTAGNVTNDGAHSYTYDSENRLVSVDGGATASYSYDNENRRWKKVTGGAITHYVWQGSQLLAEHNGSTGAVLVDYLYSGSRMIAKVEAGATRYFVSDRLSMRMVMDATGNVLGRQSHLPFGEDFAGNGAQQKHHFTSYERDAESGLDYAMNRSYSPRVGRFNQADPYKASGYMTDPQSWNRYSYANNEPINRVDPEGLDFSSIGFPWWGFIGPREFMQVNAGPVPGLLGGTSGSDTGAALPQIDDVTIPSSEMAGPTPSVTHSKDFQNLEDFLKNKMSENCKNWLRSKGMEEYLGEFKYSLSSLIIDYRSDFASTKMDLDGFHYTWREWFDRDQAAARERLNNPNAILVGLTLKTPDSSGRNSPTVYPIIILGPAYYDPNKLNDEGRAFVKKVGGLGSFQAITLLHEIFHIKTGKGDGDMEQELGIKGSIDDFFANDCKQ
jgi:RHS repeat-associated protein